MGIVFRYLINVRKLLNMQHSTKNLTIGKEYLYWTANKKEAVREYMYVNIYATKPTQQNENNW